MPEWDELNRPKGYVISVTPGFAQYGQGDERLIYMGLARKITKAARLGFEFAEIDFEALSEMFEPEITQQVATIKERQGLEVGLHLPVGMDLCLAHAYQWKFMHRQVVFGAVAGAERMKAKFILFHTSSAARPAISAGVGERTGPTKMAAWNGINLGNWIEDVSKGSFDLKDWFLARFIEVMFRSMGVAGDPGVISYFLEEVALQGRGFREGEQNARDELKDMENKLINPELEKLESAAQQLEQQAIMLNSQRTDLQKLYDRRDGIVQTIEEAKRQNRTDVIDTLTPQLNDVLSQIQNIEKRFGSIHNITIMLDNLNKNVAGLRSPEKRRQVFRDTLMNGIWKGQRAWDRYRQLESVVSYLDRSNFQEIYRYWTTQGSECEEPVAYHVVAKWMFKNKDSLYKNIVTADDRDPDQIIYTANTNPHAKPSVIEAVKQIVTAVAAKYIHGHLTVSDPEEYAIAVDKNGNFTRGGTKIEKYMGVMEYCRKHKLHIFIETNMPGTQEAEHRGGAPPGELRIIKATDHIKIVKYIDPENVSYCMDFEHLLTNYVDPEAEADELAKAGKGDGKYIRCLHTNAPRPITGAHGPIFPISNDMYILYRYLYKLRKAGCKNAYIIWEMGSYGIRESAIAYRRLVKELQQETDPEKLPEEFFGIDEVFKALQRVAIKEHAWDPLEGMLQIPEETHTFLSKAAVDKGKTEVWNKERFR
ncbi:MAG: hypothetical protein HZB66_02545 [Candidatus Aenigmarchaeota archaeon]|nr:hypothetical protein [Candidatus Aenigmarchaeota archaeon]